MTYQEGKKLLWQLGFVACALLIFLPKCSSQTAYCSGALQRLSAEAGGEIASHSGVGTTNYSSNSQCYWQLDAPPGKRVIVWFTYMDLESPNDRVTLYDGLTTSSEIAVVSVNDSADYESPKFVSSANILTVNFYSNSQYARKGFRLEYNATVSANSSACGPVTFDDASSSSGMIVSHPGYDQNSLYAASMYCNWSLPSVSGKFYQLYVGNVSLGNGDCLSVNQGTASVTGGSSNVNLCGWRAVTDMTLQVDGNFSIRFSSNGAYESTGFQIKFELQNYCPDNRNFTNSTGELVSHSGVGVSYYWNNAQCVWYITAPPDHQVRFWFSYYNVRHGDVVLVRDMGGPATVVAYLRFGMSPSPSGYQSHRRAISIAFSTDGENSGLGFRIHFNFTKIPCYKPGNMTVTKTRGYIRSHYGVFYGPYANNMDCYWHISVPVGQRIAFRFGFFHTHRNAIVTVLDGSNGSTILLSTEIWFGGVIVSSANTATVRFTTDSVRTGNGFFMHVREVDNTVNTTCGTISYGNSSNLSGVIESHVGYNLYSFFTYAPNLTCLWTLPKRPGFYINLFFRNYYLSRSDCLKIVTKRSSNGSEPGSDGNLQYCSIYSDYRANVHWLTTGDAHISFTTDDLYESSGFSIQFYYEQLACPSVQKWDSDNGEVVSHTNAGTTHYLNSMTCNWQISVSPDKQVIAWFTIGKLYSNDFVELYDGLDLSTSPSLFTGAYIPTEVGIRSTESSMTVRFTTDATRHNYGFRMRYSIAENFCDGLKILNASQGEFFDHINSSSPNYLKGMMCYWSIIAPLGYSVVAQFKSFSLYYKDYVAIYDGLHPNRSLTIGSYDGSFKFQSVSSRIFVSKSNAMLVYFVTDTGYYSRTGSGFGMKYNTTEKFCQGTELLTNDTGELASHSSAGIMGFLISSDCYWVIRVSPSKRVVARFTFFNITSRYESVTLFDGANGSTVLATLSSSFSDTTRDFITTENVLTVHLHIPESSYRSLGIKMKYEAADTLPATTSSEQASPTTARAVVSSPNSPSTAKVIPETSSAPQSATTGGKLSQTEPATSSSKQTTPTTTRAVVSSPSSQTTSKMISETSSASQSKTTGKLTEPKESFPTYVLVLAIAVPSAAVAVNAAIVGIVIHKYLQNVKRLKTHTPSNTEARDGSYAPETTSTRDVHNEDNPYSVADKVENTTQRNLGEDDYYDSIGTLPQGDPQLSTFK